MIKLYSGHISNKTVKLSVCVYLKKSGPWVVYSNVHTVYGEE